MRIPSIGTIVQVLTPLRLNFPLTPLYLLVVRRLQLRESTVMRMYARHTLGVGSHLQRWLTFLVFYSKIHPRILHDARYIDRMRAHVFEDEAATAWSESKAVSAEALARYYIADGRVSILGYLVPEIARQSRTDLRLLDLGCGTGNCITLLHHRCAGKLSTVDGVDFSEDAILQARTKFPEASFYANDLLQWARSRPATDSFQYDIAYSHLCLQLFPEPYILELYEIIREKRIARTILVSDSFVTPGAELATAPASSYAPGRYGYIRWDHQHANLLERAGWSGSLLADYRSGSTIYDETGFVYWRGDCV